MLLATSRPLRQPTTPRSARLTYRTRSMTTAEDHHSAGTGAHARCADRRDGRRAGEGDAAQRVVRSDARAVQGHQRRVRAGVEAAHGAGRGDQAVARRLGGAGARGDRRAGGGRRDARARVRHRRDRAARQDAAGGLAEEAAAQQHAVRVDGGVRRPEGEPEGDQGLERPGAGGRAGDHARTRRRRAGRGGTTWPRGATR